MQRLPKRTCLVFLFIMLLSPLAAFSAEPRPDCRVCGMWIDQYLHTRHVFTTTDGDQVMFCSLACAAKYLKTHKAEIKRMQVADYQTTELVDTDEAVYLVDSDAPPVMSYVSIIAFADRKRAENFQKEHGGKLMPFSEAQDQL